MRIPNPVFNSEEHLKVSLEEVPGEDYVDVVNERIRQQIREREENGAEKFFTRKKE